MISVWGTGPSSLLVSQLRYCWILPNAQCPVHELNETVGKQADIESGDAGYGDAGAHGQADGEFFFSLFDFAHEHGVGDLQVVVEAEDGVEHAERGQGVVAGFDQAEENEIFAPESG